jgi:hypothetical protein
MKRHRSSLRMAATVIALFCGIWRVSFAEGQAKTYERNFGQSEVAVKKALQQMQGTMAGHLPTLDGFAIVGEHALERYQRGYFQATVQVSPGSNGGSVVKVTAKVTAWYDDPQKVHAGYELLHSNGRIESDILDQLSEQLAATKPSVEKEPVEVVHSNQVKQSVESAANVPPQAKPEKSASSVARSEQPASSNDSTVSAPQPHIFDPPSSLTSSLSHGLASSSASQPSSAQPDTTVKADPERTRLQADIEQLQDVLKNQGHPKNMVAVKKSGTAVVETPSLTAKPMFLATAHDEFEMLNYNQDWVHVRISGLSRGWIWRNDLELPDTVPDAPSAQVTGGAADFFHVVREETAPFPGDWEPLRGKNVKLISVQKIDESAKETGPQLKLEFAKSVFQKSYADVAQKSADPAGIVLIFDSADGGMIAVPEAVLEKWKSGAVSDSAFWHACFFDPPETFGGGNAAGQ